LKSVKKFGLNKNSWLYDTQLLENCIILDGVTAASGIFIACYKRFTPSKELGGISTQQAKMVENLKKNGCIFVKRNNVNNTDCDYTDFYEKGVRGRKIEFYDINVAKQKVKEKEEKKNQPKLKCSKDTKQKFKDDKIDLLTLKRNKLEIDHRTPVAASKLNGIETPEFDDYLVNSGQADSYYQCLSKETNIEKRSICTACLRGENIQLPIYVEYFMGEAYMRKKEPSMPCNGCFWHDFRFPKYPKKVRVDLFK
jgi:hypothetical protein